MASVVDICNSALNLLGASTISALTDDTKNARLCNQRYEPIRNRIFRSHNWNCLIKRVQLAKDSTSPVVEFAHQYTLPSDCLRVLKIHTGVTDSIVSDIEYKIEGIADERLREARFIDATENSLDTIEANEFTNARL
jgi:hypothetical protein